MLGKKGSVGRNREARGGQEKMGSSRGYPGEEGWMRGLLWKGGYYDEKRGKEGVCVDQLSDTG